MKRKLHYVLMIMIMSLVSLSSWADRVAPTLPEGVTPQTLESGKEYYLLNVGSGFLGISKESYSYCGMSPNAEKILITQETKGYSIKIVSNGYYLSTSSDKLYWNSYLHYSSDNCTWNLTSVGSGFYTINYVPSSGTYTGFCGADNNGDFIYTNKAEGNTTWQLFDADTEIERYSAEYDLYTALNYFEVFPISKSFISYYDEIYADRANKTIEELEDAATLVRRVTQMSTGYQAPYWNEYPILWATSDGTFGDNSQDTWALPNSTKDIYGNTIYYSSGTYFERGFSNGSSTLSATVNINELSTFVYSTSGSSDDDAVIKVYVDDQLVRTLQGYQKNEYPTSKTYARFAEVLQPGKHTIKWEASTTSTNYFQIRNAGVVKSPLITVSLLEPGSLGTEVLYNTDHIKNVRRLKVKGKMNDDDWAKIKMMSGLLDLDLSEAEITEIPKYQFQVQNNDTVMQFLHRLVLPEGLEKINESAFYYSFIDTLAFPSTLKNIRENAFQYSHIQEIDMPDDCTEIYGDETSGGYRVFEHMYWLKKLTCAKNWTVIPGYTFNDDPWIEEITLPEKLEAIGNYAFASCKRMNVTFPEGLKRINEYAFYGCWYTHFGAFPESLQSIGRYAFYNCNRINNLVIPKNVTSIGYSAFESCYYLYTAELSVNQYSIADDLFDDCTRLTTLRLNSPTVATVTESSGSYPVDADKIANVDLIVPSFLVNAYKLDKYWYNFKSITGFDTSEIQDWTINNPLVLNHDRFDGTPNITIKGSYGRTPSLKINGTNAQTIKNLTIDGSYNTSSVSGKETSVIYNNNYPGQIYSNNTSNNIQITGDVQVNLWAPSKTWEFFSLPFDYKIADITFSADAVQYAIRYYDGANRATNGTSGSWKNYDKTADVIPAGTGFIIQTNKDTWCYFKAVDNDMKQNIVSYKEFSKTLAVNDCETASNKGWNLIGNPYQCFYNDHSLNFTAPITVWNNYNKNYVAYSLTDDDYAIRPNEAFFVQCPSEEYKTISFPLQGRQLTDVIESQNAAKSLAPAESSRKLINLSLTCGEQSDQTRVVLNEKASMDYEVSCDASKFMSMDSSVPQLFTINADGTQYAINERPMADGTVKLGYYAGAAGDFTISINRADGEHIYITDNEEGTTTDITENGYSFVTKAGTNLTRFTLTFSNEETTGIKELTPAISQGEGAVIYNAAGQRVKTAGKGVFIIDGKKVVK